MADAKSTLLSNMPVVIAGAVAVVAVGAWATFLFWPDEDSTRATKPVEAKAAKSDGLPPMRALPPPGSDLLPPLPAPPPVPLKPEQAAAEPGKPPAKGEATPPAKVAPPLPVTAAAPAVEKAAPVAPAPRRVEKAASESAAVSPGRYVGNISGGEGGGLTLVIASVEGGAVRGTASLAGGGVCDDDYPMQGSVRGGRLELRSTKMGGRAGDCPLSLALTPDGDRMTGSSGAGGNVQLKKR